MKRLHWKRLSPLLYGWLLVACGSDLLLPPGVEISRPVFFGEEHCYKVSLPARYSAEVVIEQHDVDLEIELADPGDGLGTFTYDAPTGERGEERISLYAEIESTFFLKVSPFRRPKPGGGRYSIYLSERPANAADKERYRADRLSAFGSHLSRVSEESSRQRALTPIREALRHWRSLGDQGRELTELEKLAWVYFSLGNDGLAGEYILQAKILARQLDDERTEARLLTMLGLVRWAKGDCAGAEAFYQESLRKIQSCRCDDVAVTALQSLGGLHRKHRAFDKAIATTFEALVLSTEADERYGVLESLQGFSAILFDLPDAQNALVFQREAQELADSISDPFYQAETRAGIGLSYLLLGRTDRAVGVLEEAVQIARYHDLSQVLASSLYQLSEAYRRLHQYDRSIESLHEAEILFRRLNHHLGLGVVLMQRARISLDEHDLGAALRGIRVAVDIFAKKRQMRHLASGYRILAMIHQESGQYDEAWVAIKESLEITESEREHNGIIGSRLSANTFRYDYYITAIEILTELARRDKRASLLQEAFEVSERARVTAKRYSWNTSGLDHQTVQFLETELSRLWDEILRLEAVNGGGAVARTLVSRGSPEKPKALRRALARYTVLSATLMQSKAVAYKAIGPTTTEAIQGALDSGTRLLSFSLGEEASWLWVVGPTTLEVYPLPERAVIEAAVQPLVASLRQNDPPLPAERLLPSLRNLSESLVGEALAGLAGVRRLVVVGEGALHYLPFGVLPNPQSERSRFLVEDFEIVRLPSASSLVDLRARRRPWRSENLSAVILSDAVYGLDDARLRRGEDRRQSGLRIGDNMVVAAPESLEPLDRLRFAAKESAAIQSYLPGDRSKVFSGFEARRDVLLRADLSSFDIVHLIAHGEADTEYPELSRLVFSRLDRQGSPVDGNLRAHEIYGLKLNAGLVVLSACETALGRAVRGEGLVGLTQGFFATGAPRVVVSLWKVNDAATAELMEAFYRHMVKGAGPPARALRQAQLELLQRGHPPNHWAPFILMGDGH